MTKSVRWVKSLLGFGSSNNKDQDEPMTEGDDPEPSPTTRNPENCDNNPGVPISSDSESEEEMEQSPDTTGDMDQSLDTSRHGVKAAPMFSVNNWDIGHMWISIFIVLFTSHGIQSSTTPEFGVLHQFTAYDCERPLSVEALQLPSHCLNHKTDDNITDPKTNLTLTDNQPYQLLQKATYHEFDAHVCK